MKKLILFTTVFAFIFLNYEGELRWKKGLNSVSDAPILCDKSGNVFISTVDLNGLHISNFDTDGNLLWHYFDNSTKGINGSGVITEGKLFQPSIFRKIIAIN